MILTAIVLAGCITTLIYTAGRARSEGQTLPKELIEIGGQRFDCCFNVQNEHGWIKAYVLQGQTIENWQTLVVVKYFDNLDSPEKYIRAMADLYSAEYPNMQFAIFEKEETGQWIIDYMVYTKANTGFVEWDYFQAEQAKDGPGIVVNQYAIRVPFSGSTKPALEKLNLAERRPELLKILMMSDFKREPIK